MSNMKVNLDKIVEQFARKRLDFLQPVYEAVTNSLESKSKNIVVELMPEVDDMFPDSPKIKEVIITDDGEGFTAENLQSFTELWSNHKISLGCKGVGRLTWLKVFNKVYITSKTQTKKVTIDFSRDFDISNDIQEDDYDSTTAKTIIKFSGVRDSFYQYAGRGKRLIDKREIADVDFVANKLYMHLLVKLLLKKKEKKEFSITIRCDENEKVIDNVLVQDLKEETFSVKGSNNQEETFTMYYEFIESSEKNPSYKYYCAHSRAVSEIKDIFFKQAPDGKSIILLLTSPYLDRLVNDERNEFLFPKSDDEIDNITLDNIVDTCQSKFGEIVLREYPQIEEKNQSVVEAAIADAPHLTKYIRENKDITKDKNKLLKEAKKKFEEEKREVESNFLEALKNISEQGEEYTSVNDFEKNIKEMSDISARELGEYIIYRQNIINALLKLNAMCEKDESILHNLIMKRGTQSDVIDNHLLPYESNLWLLDDKFMSYAYAASDTTIKKIIKEGYGIEKSDSNGSLRKPDLAVFYSNKQDADNLSCVLIELKAVGTSSDKKYAGLEQLKDYVEILANKNPNIKSFWVYLITEVDKSFARKLIRDDYVPIFSNANGDQHFIKYNKTLKMYISVLSSSVIAEDADARNKTFLEMLKIDER